MDLTFDPKDSDNLYQRNESSWPDVFSSKYFETTAAVNMEAKKAQSIKGATGSQFAINRCTTWCGQLESDVELVIVNFLTFIPINFKTIVVALLKSRGNAACFSENYYAL